MNEAISKSARGPLSFEPLPLLVRAESGEQHRLVATGRAEPGTILGSEHTVDRRDGADGAGHRCPPTTVATWMDQAPMCWTSTAQSRMLGGVGLLRRLRYVVLDRPKPCSLAEAQHSLDRLVAAGFDAEIVEHGDNGLNMWANTTVGGEVTPDERYVLQVPRRQARAANLV